MIQIAIVEDDPRFLLQVRQYLERYSRENEISFQITCFHDGDGITAFYQTRYQLIFMDIEMPFVDGLTAARQIRSQDPEVILIFLTNMPQYAVQGYEVEALAYLLKPISYFAFSHHLDRALERLQKRENDQYLVIRLKDGMQKIPVSDLYYIEHREHNLIYHTRSGDYLSRGKISEAEEQVSSFSFFRCNSGHLVNLQHVTGIRENCAIVHGEQLPISRSRKACFLASLNAYLNAMNG